MPPRNCQTCASPDRENVERELAGGLTYASVARRGHDRPSAASIRRHHQSCPGVKDRIESYRLERSADSPGAVLTDLRRHWDRALAEYDAIAKVSPPIVDENGDPLRDENGNLRLEASTSSKRLAALGQVTKVLELRARYLLPPVASAPPIGGEDSLGDAIAKRLGDVDQKSVADALKTLRRDPGGAQGWSGSRVGGRTKKPPPDDSAPPS